MQHKGLTSVRDLNDHYSRLVNRSTVDTSVCDRLWREVPNYLIRRTVYRLLHK